MPRDEVDLAKRAVDAFNRHELATPDFKWHGAAVRALGGDEDRGREGIERLDRDQSENWEELRNVAEDGERVVVVGRLLGRGGASGLDVASESDAMVVTVRDGKIVHVHEQTTAEALKAVGRDE